MKKLIVLLLSISFVAAISADSYGQIMDSSPRDAAYDKTNTKDNEPIPYPYVREADVIWSKRIWRVIDLRQKLNQPFYYPKTPSNGRRNLMQVLMDALKPGTKGSLTAYDATAQTDEFEVPLTYREIMNKLEETDTIQLQRDTPPYDYYDTVIQKKFDPTEVKRFRIKEDWFFDKQRSVMEVRILGICPVRNDYDEKGVFRGREPLFWIYFPDARSVLAKAEVYSRFNGTNRATYDDVFFKRMFDSHIIKEENVYNRKITEYATGLDALIEARRVKKELFEFEQDLWEY
ncbi:MAG: gliding motility protein GldN [Bacteroidales bacterium]|nr:gliding motility protein GldN [Bacteroidales bacterium]